MPKTMEQIQSELSAPFPAADVEWRIQHAAQDKKRGLAVPYLQSRAIQSRLDAVVGPYNWKAEYKPWHNVGGAGSQLCGIAVYCEERGEWVQKWDGAENTDIEPVKGGISDSFKRAAVLWGIGRYLYGLAATWVDVEQRGKNYAIIDKELRRLDSVYEKAVGGKSGNVTPLPERQPDSPASRETPRGEYEFAVSAVRNRQFASGPVTALRLVSPDGNSVDAFLRRADQNIAEGVCLKNVKLSQLENQGYQFHTLDSYEVA